MTIQAIENNETYKQVLADSFGGIMYDVANRGKYDAGEVIKIWDELSPSEQNISGGIMSGAISFLKGE